MKITTAKKDKAINKKYVRISFVKKGSERFFVDTGVETLEVTADVKKITPRTLQTTVRGIIQSAKMYKIKHLAIDVDSSMFPKCSAYSAKWLYQSVAENLLLAEYEYTHYKTKKDAHVIQEVLIITDEDKVAQEGVKHGEVTATYTNICRDIGNTPGSDMTPEGLGNAAKKHCMLPNTKVTVHNLAAIKKMKMGGLLGVGQGAKDTPRFIVIEYNGLPKGSNEKPIVYVGKGITFDTGGLQTKPGMSMYEMHLDMSGGAAVIGALGAIAKLKLKKHVIGLIPAAENAVSGDAMRPGDILTMMSGKTVEVLHTDAEGRLVLADALYFAQRYDPSLIIDVATLTGASLSAVGQHANVILTKERKLEDMLRDLGEESGEYTFPLPLWDEYIKYTKSTRADISNLSTGDGRQAGAINGAAFLSHFVKGCSWAHIDMAPRMTSNHSDKLAKGSTGEPTRLLVKIAENY